MKNQVLELKKIRFQKAKEVCELKSTIEVLDYHFCCLFSNGCINKSILMSHSEAKQADTKVRAFFREVFETLQVKIPRSETSLGTHKTETFPITRVLMVRTSRKEAIFDGMSTKEEIVDAFPVEDEENIEEEFSEATVT